MRHARIPLALLGILTSSVVALAQTDTYKITDAEKAACTGDAMRLCASAYPSESKLLACMIANKGSLTPTCLTVFNAGLKRRHLVGR